MLLVPGVGESGHCHGGCLKLSLFWEPAASVPPRLMQQALWLLHSSVNCMHSFNSYLLKLYNADGRKCSKH